MLLASLSDGRVLRFDLTDPQRPPEWERFQTAPPPGVSVTGLSLCLDGARADLPLPRRFRSVRFSAAAVYGRDGSVAAERVSAAADDVVLTLTMHRNGRVGRVRVDLDRRGRRRWSPECCNIRPTEPRPEGVPWSAEETDA